MRQITRQSLCLACQRGLCQKSVRRSFQTSVHLASEPRPPNSHPEDSSSFHRALQSQLDDVLNKKTASRESEHEERENAGETRASSFRKSSRLRRTPEVPKPPPIPEWFLRRNVRLSQSPSTSSNSAGRDDSQNYQFVNRKNGNVLFEIQGYSDPEDQGHEPKEGESHDSSSNDIPSSDSGIAVGSGAEKSSANAQPSNNLKDDFFIHNAHPPSSQPPLDANAADIRKSKLQKLRPSQIDPVSNIGSDALRWAFLEAEESVRAAFAVPTLAAKPSSFAASRVDISLQCPDLHSHDYLDDCVAALARHVDADLIRLDANDIAELTADYVGQGYDEPKSFANLGHDVFDGFKSVPTESQNSASPRTNEKEEGKDEEEDALDGEDISDENLNQGGQFSTILGANVLDLGRAMSRAGPLMDKLRGSIVDIGVGGSQRASPPAPSFRDVGNPLNNDSPRDDARLAALFEQLLQAPEQKRIGWTEQTSSLERPTPDSSYYFLDREAREQRWRDDRKMHTLQWRSDTSQMITELSRILLQRSQEKAIPENDLDLEPSPISSPNKPEPSQRAQKTIVHVRDLHDICASQMGDSIVNMLLKTVRRRRCAGEQVVIVGTTAQDVPGPFSIAGEAPEENSLRSITLPPLFAIASLQAQTRRSSSIGSAVLDYGNFPKDFDKSESYWRICEINARHVQSVLRNLQPDAGIDLLDEDVLDQLRLPHLPFSGERVLSIEEVQRLALTAVGLCQHHAKAENVAPIHLSLANQIIARSDFVIERLPALKKMAQPLINAAENIEGTLVFRGENPESSAKADPQPKTTSSRPVRRRSESKLDRVKKMCNSHEARLLSGVVDPHSIKTGFEDVHATPETIDALKMLTTLSLLRPDAFKYGVLANDRLSGLLLYGPPGTGKTLLAKAVAKQAKANVMEISGAQIYEKYVGEGEKMVRAVFSLAKKLSPCVVFMDEADAIFGSRSNAGNRSTHREIINQFLREWDGMDDHGVFLMVATNRPFDLDDAVLRRLPRRLLVDLPVAKDRESILGIHLRNENLDSSVSLSKLAEQTPLYSGSDLKNLAVAAALAAVREENDQKEEEPDFKYPEKRTLTEKHFSKALTEISASISEDMSTLNAIRKFDEQYGDRKGRRKKSGMGFGATDGPVDESAARVRQSIVPAEDIDLGSQPGASPTPP